MQSLETAQSLVDEVLTVIIRELLCTDDSVHVSLHQFLHCVVSFGCSDVGPAKSALSLYVLDQPRWLTHLDQIHLVEGLQVCRTNDIKDGDDVLVAEMAEKLNFTEGSETEHRVIKRRYSFDGYSRLRRHMDSGAFVTATSSSVRCQRRVLVGSARALRVLDSPHHTVCSFSDDIDDLVRRSNVECGMLHRLLL